MTTLAAILTQRPLALAIIAGLVLRYPMVLLMMPMLIGFTLKRR